MTDEATDIPGPGAEGLQRRLSDGVLWLVLDRPAPLLDVRRRRLACS